MRAAQTSGVAQVLLAGAALDLVAHVLGGSVGRGGERAVTAGREQANELVVEAVSAQAGDAKRAARVDDRAQDLRQARVIRDCRTYQSHAAGLLRNLGQDVRGLDLAHTTAGRPAHHAVGTRAATPARGLDEKHVGELGVGCDDLGKCGQAGVVNRKDCGRVLAVEDGHKEARRARQGFEQRTFVRTVAEDLHKGGQRFLRLAHHNDVGHRPRRHGIGEG